MKKLSNNEAEFKKRCLLKKSLCNFREKLAISFTRRIKMFAATWRLTGYFHKA